MNISSDHMAHFIAVQSTNAILKCAATLSVKRHKRDWVFMSFDEALKECEKAHQEIYQRLFEPYKPRILFHDTRREEFID